MLLNFLPDSKINFTIGGSEVDYKFIIKESGYKKSFLAQYINVSPTMISLFLKGERNLTPEKLHKLNKILNIK